MNKNILREEYKFIRHSINDKKKRSKIIVRQISGLQIYQKARSIALYSPLEDEVDVSGLALKIIEDNKQLSYPKIDRNNMDFFIVKTLDELDRKGDFGILEPSSFFKAAPEDLNLIIVPMIAFDIKLNRLGYGKGYYDRYLEKCSAFKIGVAFHSAFIGDTLIDIDDKDVRLDMVITEKKIFQR